MDIPSSQKAPTLVLERSGGSHPVPTTFLRRTKKQKKFKKIDPRAEMEPSAPITKEQHEARSTHEEHEEQTTKPRQTRPYTQSVQTTWGDKPGEDNKKNNHHKDCGQEHKRGEASGHDNVQQQPAKATSRSTKVQERQAEATSLQKETEATSGRSDKRATSATRFWLSVGHRNGL